VLHHGLVRIRGANYGGIHNLANEKILFYFLGSDAYDMMIDEKDPLAKLSYWIRNLITNYCQTAALPLLVTRNLSGG
jgi:hypothetical protein